MEKVYYPENSISFLSYLKMERFIWILLILLISSCQVSSSILCEENFMLFDFQECSLKNIKVENGSSINIENYGKNKVQVLEIDQSSMPLLPNELFVKYSNISILVVKNSKLIDIRNGNFKNAVKLKNLYFHLNNLTDFKEGAFEGSNNLVLLSITKEFYLTNIEKGAFRGLSTLTRLIMSDGILEYIVPETFDDLVKLQFLEMNNQKFKVFPAEIFKNNLNLLEIDIDRNQIEKVLNGTFSSIKSISRINLSQNKLINSRTFKSDMMLLDGNFLKKLNIMTTSTFVDANNNKIDKIICAKNPSIVYLSLNYNQLKTLQCIPKMVNITNLNLAFNQFTALSKQRLLKMAKMKYLNLIGNKLTNPGVRLFTGMPSIQTLQIEKLKNYSILKQSFPYITNLVLETKHMKCAEVEDVAKVLRAQKITIKFFEGYGDLKGFQCRIPASEFNKNPQ